MQQAEGGPGSSVGLLQESGRHATSHDGELSSVGISYNALVAAACVRVGLNRVYQLSSFEKHLLMVQYFNHFLSL